MTFWSAFRHFGTHFVKSFHMSISSWMDPTCPREMPSYSVIDLAEIRWSSQISSWTWSIISGVVTCFGSSRTRHITGGKITFKLGHPVFEGGIRWCLFPWYFYQNGVNFLQPLALQEKKLDDSSCLRVQHLPMGKHVITVLTINCKTVKYYSNTCFSHIVQHHTAITGLGQKEKISILWRWSCPCAKIKCQASTSNTNAWNWTKHMKLTSTFTTYKTTN